MPIEKWDDDGLGIEPNNLTAINSLIAYRSLRYGRHLDLIVTDQHSFRGDDPTDAEGVGKIYDPTFNGMFSEPAMIALDAGRAFNGGKPPAELNFGDDRHPQSAQGFTAADDPREPSRRHGSWTGSVGRRQPGRSGAIRWARSTCAPTRRTFPMD